MRINTVKLGNEKIGLVTSTMVDKEPGVFESIIETEDFTTLIVISNKSIIVHPITIKRENINIDGHSETVEVRYVENIWVKPLDEIFYFDGSAYTIKNGEIGIGVYLVNEDKLSVTFERQTYV